MDRLIAAIHFGTDERQRCSVRSRSPPSGVLTVSGIKLTFGSPTGEGPSVSYTRYIRHSLAAVRSCSFAKAVAYGLAALAGVGCGPHVRRST
jgi:hypothetical protein